MNQTILAAIAEAILFVGSKREFAQIVGVSYNTVLDWSNGRSGVSVPNALKIEKITGGKIKAKDLINLPWEKLG